MDCPKKKLSESLDSYCRNHKTRWNSFLSLAWAGELPRLTTLISLRLGGGMNNRGSREHLVDTCIAKRLNLL